jgi:hypothetical protein
VWAGFFYDPTACVVWGGRGIVCSLAGVVLARRRMMAKLEVVGVVVDGDDGQTFSMAQVDSSDEHEKIRNSILTDFRNMGMNAEQVLVRVQYRDTLLFQRMAQVPMFRIDYVLGESGWRPVSEFSRLSVGGKFGFMKNGKIYECGRDVETLYELSDSGFPVGLICDGFHKVEFRMDNSYEVVARI